MPKKLPTSAYPTDKASNAAIATKLVAAAVEGVSGVGTDVELISAIPVDNESFLERNFTPAELAYCRSAPDTRASLAARWAAKEATVSLLYFLSRRCPKLTRTLFLLLLQFKSMKVASNGGGASLIDIEVVSTDTAPIIRLHGEAKVAAESKGITGFELSLSHSDDVAVAVVVAKSE